MLFGSKNSLKLLKNAEEFKKCVEAPEAKVVVMASTTFCMPCKKFTPIVADVSKEFEGKVEFVKVNLDASPDINSVVGVGSVPTLLFFNNAQEAYRSIGSCSKEELVNQVHKVFGI